MLPTFSRPTIFSSSQSPWSCPAILLSTRCTNEVSNLYVPGRATRLSASAQRYAIGLSLAPTDNFITEFVPDIASHIHVQVVFVQRIINQVAKTNGAGGS